MSETKTKELEIYWNENGKFQKEYNEMWGLVPSQGEVKIPDNKELEHALEMVRCVSRCYYEYYNNGCCNLTDTETESCEQCEGCGYLEVGREISEDEEDTTEDCYYCDGSGEQNGETTINEYWENFVDKAQEYAGNYRMKSVLINAGRNYPSFSFSDSDNIRLENVADLVFEKAYITYKAHAKEVA
jgi:hypothetical protein